MNETRDGADMLSLSSHPPEQAFAAGQVVVCEGDAGGAIWVLVAGALQVVKGAVLVNTITRPGALVGEVSVLLNARYGATVQATEPGVQRRAGAVDGVDGAEPAVAAVDHAGAAPLGSAREPDLAC